MALLVRDLTFTYGAGPVLSGVTAGPLQRGSVACLIGPNGSGKSTLFRCLAGLLRSDAAELSLDGLDLARMAWRERSKRVFHLTQEANEKTTLTVFEIVLLARKSIVSRFALGVGRPDAAVVETVLRELGIAALAHRPLNTLSGGQRQLAAIGQALVREPDILLLDEPTSSLDVRRQLEVLDIVRRATTNRKMVTIVALHDLSLAARLGDVLLLLSDGLIKRQGEPASVLADTAVADTYGVGIQIERSSRGTLLVEPFITR